MKRLVQNKILITLPLVLMIAMQLFIPHAVFADDGVPADLPQPEVQETSESDDAPAVTEEVELPDEVDLVVLDQSGEELPSGVRDQQHRYCAHRTRILPVAAFYTPSPPMIAIRLQMALRHAATPFNKLLILPVVTHRMMERFMWKVESTMKIFSLDQ